MTKVADPGQDSLMHQPLLVRSRAVLVLLYAAAALFFVGIALRDHYQIDESIDAIALERGRVLFGLIELTRDWNAQHGGVYAPVSANNPPNPYLDHPQRDIRTTDGRELTMVNPAYMTRQVAEIAEKRTGVRFHITSLNPIRPANEADAWEAESLRLFEASALKERIVLIKDYPFAPDVQRPVHRYMAPLPVKPACLKCHEKQGYQVGDIRGGISVTMPAEELLVVHDQRTKSLLLIVLASFIVTSALLHLLVGGARRHYLKLQSIAQAQEDVIASRTSELAERNAELQREMEGRRERENELRLANAVFESAAEAIVVTDEQNRILRVNPAFTVITGYTPREVLGHNPSILSSGHHDKEFYRQLWETLQQVGHWEGEIWNRRKSGDIYVEWLSIVRIEGMQGGGRYLAVFQDITERKEAEDELHFKANHDALTNLPNRSLFYDRLEAAINQAKRYQRDFALLMVDLDRFKEVNDTLGHAAGDELLVEAARRLTSCVREADTVARLGGDEFAVIVSDLTQKEFAEQVVRRAVSLLAEPYYLDAGTVNISGCIGMAFYPQHGQQGDELQRNADSALYAAKQAGRNAYRVYASPRRDDKPQGDLL